MLMSLAIIKSHHESSFLGSTFEIDNESNDPFVIVYESLLGKSHTISHTYDDVIMTSLPYITSHQGIHYQ